jgi:deazaflavin-dependent oxidoreductase (nitroreductase family)
MSGDRKRRLVVAFEKYVQNPPVKAALRAGLPMPMFALLETTGRASGKRRHTPVINGRQGDRFWIVAEHGRRAQYVRNLEADPNVRVKSGGRWYAGRAHISTTMTRWHERGGWPTLLGRCTRRTASLPVCSAPNRSPSASTSSLPALVIRPTLTGLEADPGYRSNRRGGAA